MNVRENEKNEDSNIWYLDSGASVSLTKEKCSLSNTKKSNAMISGPLKNGKLSRAQCEGEIVFEFENEIDKKKQVVKLDLI